MDTRGKLGIMLHFPIIKVIAVLIRLRETAYLIVNMYPYTTLNAIAIYYSTY